MPKWVKVCAWAAVAAALPTVLWRAVVGFGLPLGTPQSWRAFQHIPGSGTAYVLTLSAIQLLAALATLRLARPEGDRLPWGRRLPRWGVAAIAFGGAAVLFVLCALSAVNFGRVDPFAGRAWDGWRALCLGCYLCAPLWPVFLLVTTVGYLRHRPG
ncbi:hypothetical protein [Amycolatopsis sp. PS_44_ISF1]|uniref:hypothetical protein n=1 Tax=Amycolatopsis sp. PS_44_ISF1 TaxID=2974917 RepID=UPI0028DF89E1|nr:hypothetical protein [Amycolatopsis sp. PS_44_ISF1]MDT8911600.1 hypothetical protein [Amycolatopsis sp. PS_44_ISF1]